ncbi:hypothetical protein ANCCEY_11801 [Ancylostoma ceylanicum]|uniref:ABC transmembrane type-1 domain-containing protein n=1 Tax=Ancylostoma ceylanicum TaxID=53326 RepID=A0A0D6LGP5_9BILA|nr:hypothetical protein ANCCEY_11801 [Ancylostoma ceylanicum]
MATALNRLGWGVALSVLDAAVCVLCAYFHGPTPAPSNITSQFTSFSFFTCTVDLFALCIVRAFFWLLPAIFHKTGRADNLPHLSQVIFCTSLLMYAASPTKLLLLTENLKPGTFLPAGDYAFLLWNFIAALILDVSWKWYFHYPPSSYVILDEMDEDDEAAPKETFELIFRLLQYCKREWIWHISGFSWLFIYSITRIFVPYYTGQVIATVVATKSYPSLATAVYVMTFISFVRFVALLLLLLQRLTILSMNMHSDTVSCTVTVLQNSLNKVNVMQFFMYEESSKYDSKFVNRYK